MNSKVDEELILNLDDFSLNNIFAKKICLGSGNMLFQDLGFDIYISEGIISGFFVCLFSGYNGYEKFNGKFIKDRVSIEICEDSTWDDVISIFGMPQSEWHDDTEKNAKFSIADISLEFSWNNSFSSMGNAISKLGINDYKLCYISIDL